MCLILTYRNVERHRPVSLREPSSRSRNAWSRPHFGVDFPLPGQKHARQVVQGTPLYLNDTEVCFLPTPGARLANVDDEDEFGHDENDDHHEEDDNDDDNDDDCDGIDDEDEMWVTRTAMPMLAEVSQVWGRYLAHTGPNLVEIGPSLTASGHV